MPLTDQEKSQIREAASVPSNQRANPDPCRALLSLLDELDSTRQQLAALRDKWRERAKLIAENIGASSTTKSDMAPEAADDIDKILKGTP